jgi:anti-sigma B factor antagonist
MKIKQREVDGVVVLDVSGEMYGGPENMKLREIAKECIDAGKLKLLINFSKVKWVASTGLGILVSTKASYEKAGGVIKLCNLNERVLTLFQVTKINTTMSPYASEDEAIAAFAG